MANGDWLGLFDGSELGMVEGNVDSDGLADGKD
jgi:hypothetical protein